MDYETFLPPRAAARVDHAVVQAISDWLVAQGLQTAGFEALFAGFCQRLTEAGLPLWRGYVGMRTLHPSVDAIAYIWRPEVGIQAESFRHDDLESEAMRNSPFAYMLERELGTLRARLDRDPSGPDFPIFEEFRGGGATDYYARIVGFRFAETGTDRRGFISSWATDRPGGFSDADIATLDRLLPRLGLSLKATLAWEIAGNLLDTYVGREAGRRILGGNIRRGEAETIRAVVLFADLRGFTAASDSIPQGELMAMLDAYFECMVAPVMTRRGQVLKFVGDGLLAVFDLAGAPADVVCHAALDAALDALARVAALNGARAAGALPTLPLRVALHIGDVLYGNVGAHDRQDFTVIGPAVNEASRIEELSGALDKPLLVSAAFAREAGGCCDRLVSVGRHTLRGLPEPQELFTVKPG